ncbi:MAG: class II fructose-bisphosphate aldolase, partial [Clostridia bacterium]
MALVEAGKLLRDAQRQGYAVGAFNVMNLEMAQAVIAAAEKMESPVLVQTTAGILDYAPPEAFFAIVSVLAAQVRVPIALHLDHGNGFAWAQRAAQAGYTSLMIDGSTLPYEQNVALTRRVVEMAGAIPVEAELGMVSGQEDRQMVTNGRYTDPAQAADFVARTGVASLAVAIGTAHGVYQGTPKLDLERLSAIRAAVSVPLVLHGTSGVPFDQVRACIQRGICKLNYATELRMAFSGGVRDVLREQPQAFDPRVYLEVARARVMALVCERITLCG